MRYSVAKFLKFGYSLDTINLLKFSLREQVILKKASNHRLRIIVLWRATCEKWPEFRSTSPKTGDSASPEWPPTAIFVALDDSEASGPSADWSGSRAWPHVTGESPKGDKAPLAEAAMPRGPGLTTEDGVQRWFWEALWLMSPGAINAVGGDRREVKWQRSDSESCITSEETQASRAGKFSYELLAMWGFGVKQRWLLNGKTIGLPNVFTMNHQSNWAYICQKDRETQIQIVS